jgi:hypothetical protein
MRASHVSTRPDKDYEQYEANNHADNAGKKIKVQRMVPQLLFRAATLTQVVCDVLVKDAG